MPKRDGLHDIITTDWKQCIRRI